MNAINSHIPDAFKRSASSQRLNSESRQGVGSVSLVGAGPGAADLLTVRALKALERADVVYYDSLVGDDVLECIKAGARRVFVGKRKGSKVMEQAAIEAHLRDDALAGHHVVRLKGGDPFIFGRGGEELFNLRADGVPVEVIPGITAAGAAAAEHSIPLTHRDVATSVTFATGHAFDGSTPGLNASVLSKGTLVVYMGISNADQIAAQLLDAEVPGATAVTIIERASLPGQRSVRSSLENVVDDIASNQVVAPALLIIGDVAAYGTELEPSSNTHAKPESQDSFAWVHHPMG